MSSGPCGDETIRNVLLVALASVFLPGCELPPTNFHLFDARLLDDGEVDLEAVEGSASGLTHDAERGTLFLVVDRPAAVYELGLDGEVRRRIVLEGFKDTEAICHLEGTTFAIAEERQSAIRIVEIDDDTRVVRKPIRSLFVGSGADAGNRGIEGLAYDSARLFLYAVKESSPRKIFRVRLDPSEHAPVATQLWDFEQVAGFRDLSGLAIDPEDGSLWILSQESRCVVNFTVTGEERGRIYLVDNYSGLQASVWNAEGVTFDDEGRLYVCSESNRLYRFSRVGRDKKPGR